MYILAQDELITTNGITCGRINGEWISGSLTNEEFTPLENEIEVLKKGIKKASGYQKKGLIKKLEKLQKEIKLRNKICANAGPGTSCVGTPTPTNTPEPTFTEVPTATPTNTPEPTFTEVPTPTSTNTPEPTFTEVPTYTPTPDHDEEVSEAQIKVEGIYEYSFNPRVNSISFSITGSTFNTDPDSVTILLNNKVVGADIISVDSNKISFSSSFPEGKNELAFYGSDIDGKLLYKELVFWAGSNSIEVFISDTSGMPVTIGSITATLGDDSNVSSTANFTDGRVIFNNLPDRTVLIEAFGENNFYGWQAVTGSSGSLSLVLEGLRPASSIDNNQFIAGLDGWNTLGDTATIVPHVEAVTAPSFRSAAVNDLDFDLVLRTLGAGKQTVSRSFKTKPGTKVVSVRYKFITSEVPGGYYGTQFNDYYSITLRTGAGGAQSRGSSMNDLGLAAFDQNGDTGWQEVSIPVSEKGDIVQIDAGVANVADGLYNSSVVIDKIEEKKFAISSVSLRDIDNTNLSHISTDAHTYFSGNTLINGVIELEGEAEDQVSTLNLQIRKGGQIVATSTLGSNAQKILIGVPFGDDNVIKITASQLLFMFSSGQLASLGGDQDESLLLQVSAESKNGEKSVRNVGSLPKLVRYQGANRYGQRDVADGGDDWVRPSARTVVAHFSGIQWGDFSNMNGGVFAPHASHRLGRDVDGFFSGFNNRDAQTAATILGHLNDPLGSRISVVWVTYSKTAHKEFYDAIKNVTLNDSRKAIDVIRSIPGHSTHFHWRIN